MFQSFLLLITATTTHIGLDPITFTAARERMSEKAILEKVGAL